MTPLYSKPELTINDLPLLGNKWYFVGIDLAPNEMLETGIAVLDRSRNICRMDKLSTGEDILHCLDSLGPPENVIVSLDIPKNLNIIGRFRQEEIKMHPLRLTRPGSDQHTDRRAARVWDVHAMLTEAGILTFLYFNYQAKMKYDLFIPFRTRTPQGCRALQSVIKTNLGIQNMSSNLSPSSVLDAMIGAYASWSVFMERDNLAFQSLKLYQESLEPDQPPYFFLEPKSRIHACSR